MVKDLGELKLRDTEEFEIFYITVQETFIFADQEYPNYIDTMGKIKVYHDGFYVGTPEEMQSWLERSVIEHIIEKEYVVKDNETITGDAIWKWKV